MNIQLSVPDWLKLPYETRLKLAEIFELSKSKGSHVEQMGSESIVRSDGHTHEDLAVITLEKMYAFLGLAYDPTNTETDFPTLFHAVVAKVEQDKELEVKEVIIDSKQLMIEEWVAVLHRIKGQAAEKDMQPHLVEVVKRIFEIKPEPNAIARPKGLPKKGKKA